MDSPNVDSGAPPLALTYQVRTILGDTRPVVRWYGDGSADCPYCATAQSVERNEVRDGACHNPACDAHPGYLPERLAEAREQRAAREREGASEVERARWRRDTFIGRSILRDDRPS